MISLKWNSAKVFRVSEGTAPGKYVMYHVYGPDEGGPWETWSDDPDSFDPNDAEEVNLNTVEEVGLELVSEEDFSDAPGAVNQ